MASFIPEGLSKKQIDSLIEYSKETSQKTLEQIINQADGHLEKIREVCLENTFINVDLAETIYAVFQEIARDWDRIPGFARPWCAGMMRYFATVEDEENDFSSPIGFEDDVEVVNACLRLAGRENLCIVPEELPQKTVSPGRTDRRAPFSPVKMPLASGMRVQCRDAEWLVTRVEQVEDSDKDGKKKAEHAVHCVGADDLVRGHEAIFLTHLDDIIPVDPRKTEIVNDASKGYKLSRLFLEAQLRQMPVAGIEPDLDGLGVFKAMRFQVETVARALKQLRPRLLLADAVGLGKTIQVGMILTELMRRGRANRILVLAKKSMLTQFQAELWNRFNIPLVRLDSAGIARLRLQIPANKNPFEVYHRVIISIDTLKNVGRYEHFLKNTRWDVVVIDEAHNVAGASVPERDLSYRLARQLSRRVDSILLTTATPHNGKRETFGRLMSLLDPSVIPDPNFREYDKDDVKDFFLMRFKEDVRSDAGDMLTDRQVIPISKTTSDATIEEERIYEILAQLRKESAKSFSGDKEDQDVWTRHPMVQYVLYKLFLSSPEACIQTVRNRLNQLNRDASDNPEIPYLTRLESALEKIDIRKSSRYALLKKQLSDIGWSGGKGSPRVLLFTESPRTQKALAPALAKDFGFKYSDRFEDQCRQVLATLNGSTRMSTS
ncbi:MAG: DEAD/DEAH box helicase [Deltaproteobacteria bacterium]|nr:DEAD/DEAH box helicase [Deltaproteobacteria bacterium]